MPKHFGKTWWGEQWLRSLSNIDYDNRLPRGSAYARKGAVTNIKIDENNIWAKVAGSRPKPYDVTVIIPPFFEEDVKKLIKAIALKPVIISKLLNRDLDPEILAIAERCGLKVFPKQWTDFKMQCSCPDWAVPCKHLAAVIYKVSAEIDNNPFLAFSLHRVNLPLALKKENIHIQHQEKNNIPLLKNLLLPEVSTKDKKNEEKAALSVKDSYQKLDFSILFPIQDSLIQILADEPVFYQNAGNFREKYTLALRKAIRNAERIIQGKKTIDDYIPTGKKTTHEDSLINHHTTVLLHINSSNAAGIIIEESDKKNVLIPFMSELWHIPVSQIQNYQPSVAALKNSFLLAVNLIANGAVVPQIIQLENGRFAVRWLPAMLSKPVRLLVQQLQQTLPDGILQYSDKTNHVIEQETAIQLLSVWLNILMQRFSETGQSDLFLGLFFDNFKYNFNAPGEQALSGGIYQWLQRYYFTQGDFKPEIVVEELRNEQFLITVNIKEINNPFEKPALLRDVLALKKHEAKKFEILQSLAQLSSFIPGLDNYINTQGDDLITMNMHTFAPFLMQAIPVIQLLDIDILLPKALQHILKPKASVRIKQKAAKGNGFMRLDKLLDFDWQVAIGDAVMNEEEFKKLLKNSDGLIKYKTNYIYVSPADLEKLHKHFSSSKTLSAFEIMRTALSNDYFGAKINLTDEVKSLIKELSDHKEIPLPKEINATLRPYQHRGFSWMYRNTQIGFGSVIADDMGLGKTLQVITTLLKYKEEKALNKEKALVIAPTGLLSNWQAEFEKFAPSLVYKLYHGTSRKLNKIDDDFDVMITSYGIVRSDADELRKMKWHVVITDEAQNIKNVDTAQSKAVKSIAANTFIAMSGTPVENRLTELWSIMDFCNRGFLGNIKEFKDNFAIPIENQNDISIAEKLKTITAPFMMRRLKSDKTIISDLPDKIEIDSYGTLTKSQAGLYEKTLHKALEEIAEIKSSDQKSLFVRQGLVLQMILALKQICNHPTQFLKNNVFDAALSGKVELLFDKLESIVESNEKVLIFTQFTEMGKLLQRFIKERFDEDPLFYHGGCSLKQRKEMVENFQTNIADRIFILSLKAAGTGLNLTAANHVIHYDLWWNPAVEAQATDRAYRIGQKSNVMVHRFITKSTFEERINDMIQSKKHLANMTIATGESWIGNLSNTELKNIFELNVQ
jgi:uncharacterized Zn finger protein/superfamily II DNA or RNA helicase